MSCLCRYACVMLKQACLNKIFKMLIRSSLGCGCIFALSVAGYGVAYAQNDLQTSDFFQTMQQNQGQQGNARNAQTFDPQANPGMQLPVDDTMPSYGGIADPYASVQSAEQIEEEIRDEAFNAAITGLLPLQPDEIRKLLEKYDETQQAVEVPIYPYPRPEVVVQTVSLDPGNLPPVIKVATGHVATLNIVDITGSPWPIQDVSWAGNFEVVRPEEGGHVMRITPLSEFAYGNLSIRLLELKTPIIFTLQSSRDTVHYRFDARIPEYGPYANAPLIEGNSLTIAAGDAKIGSILDGVMPDGATKLNVIGVDGRTTAYKLAENTYVRTPLTLLSPGWSSSVSSADGMRVYVLANAPVLLLSDRGQVVRARITARSQDGE